MGLGVIRDAEQGARPPRAFHGPRGPPDAAVCQTQPALDAYSAAVPGPELCAPAQGPFGPHSQPQPRRVFVLGEVLEAPSIPAAQLTPVAAIGLPSHRHSVLSALHFVLRLRCSMSLIMITKSKQIASATMNISEQRNQAHEDTKEPTAKRQGAGKKADQGRGRDSCGRRADASRAEGQVEDPWWLKLGQRDDRKIQTEIRRHIQEMKLAALALPQGKIERISCIYMIANVVNGRAYIGLTTDLRRRVWHHKTTLRCGKHICKPLQRDWSLCGEEAFRFFPILPDMKAIRYSHYMAEEVAISVHEVDECYNKIAEHERRRNKEGEVLKARFFKMTDTEWAAFNDLGGLEWLMAVLKKAKPPA